MYHAKLLLLAVASTALAATAHAQSMGATGFMTGNPALGWYAGANAGGAHTDIKTTAPAGTSFNSVTTDEWDGALKVFGGYRFHPNFALEGGYTRLGSFGFNATTTPPGSVNFRFKNDGWNLDLVPMVPLATNFSIFGRIGAYYNESRASTSTTGPFVATSIKDRDWDLKTGFGLQYDLTRVLALRIEFERFNRLGPTHQGVSFYSAGLVYMFGR